MSRLLTGEVRVAADRRLEASGPPLVSSTELPVVVYTPESPLLKPRRLVRQMTADLVASRELARRLFIRDVSAKYRQSLLGYFWAFAPAIVTTLIFTFLNAQRMIQVGATPVPYPAFVLIGMLLWQTFLDALNSPLQAVTNARAMLAKINFPREALVLSGVAEVGFNVGIRALLLVPVFLYYQLPVTFSLPLALVGVASLMLLGLALGVLITPFGVLYGDVGRAVALAAGPWMLLTPVVYPAPSSGLGAMLWLNPVSPLLQTTRDWLTSQPALHLQMFVIVSLGACLVLLFAWVLYRLSMPMLIERLGG